MKRPLLLIWFLSAMAGTCLAGACPNGTLATYTAPGFSCTVGSLTFSNFTYTGTASGGASIVTASAIGVSLVSSGLQFSGPFGVGFEKTQDGLIGFTVTVSSGNVIGFTSSDGTFGAGGTGTVSVATTGNNGAEAFLFLNTGGTVASQSATFGGVPSLPVITDIAVNGNNSTAVAGSVSEQFTTSP